KPILMSLLLLLSCEPTPQLYSIFDKLAPLQNLTHLTIICIPVYYQEEYQPTYPPIFPTVRNLQVYGKSFLVIPTTNLKSLSANWHLSSPECKRWSRFSSGRIS